MAIVIMTYTDTANGGVTVHTTNPPFVGDNNTPAQALALDAYRMAQHDAAVVLNTAAARQPIKAGTLADLAGNAE